MCVCIYIYDSDNPACSQVLNTIVAMFSEYSSSPFSIEPVHVHYAADAHLKLAGQTVVTPDLSEKKLSADVAYIQKACELYMNTYVYLYISIFISMLCIAYILHVYIYTARRLRRPT